MSQPEPNWSPPPAPVPVQALPYSIPTTSFRPGIITAIGVMSIVVACLSGISSLGSGMYGVGFFILSKSMARMSSVKVSGSSTVMSYSTSANAMSGGSGSSGAPASKLTPGDAGVAVNALEQKLSLDPSHIRELDRMMRMHGRQVLGGDEDTRVTSATVAADVISSTPQSGTSPASFTTAEGTTTVWADRASFAAADGSIRIDTSARHHTDNTQRISAGTGTASAGASNTTLTPAQVNGVVSAAVTNAATPLNPAQLAALRAELSAPNQSLVTVGNSTPVTTVINQPGRNVTIIFDTGNMLVLNASGGVISSGPPALPNFKVGVGVVTVLMLEALASVGLAIFLLVVGIQVLAGSFRARRLLKIYAWLKIPLAVTAGIALPIMFYEFVGGVAASTPGGGAAPVAAGFAVWGVVMTILSLAFPVALLITLRTRTVRNYYNAVSAGT